MKRILCGVALALALASPADAIVPSGTGNSNPHLITGQVPSATQWNGYFSNKFDYAGGVLGGALGLPAANTASASLNIAPGTPPTAPNNGDIWATNAGLFTQVSGETIGPLGAGGGGGGGSGGGGVLVWQPSGNYANVSVDTSGASRVGLPSGSPAYVAVYNYGTQAAAVVLGNSSTTIGAFANGGDVVEPGATYILPTGSNTYVIGISLTGTTTLQISGGTFVAQPVTSTTNLTQQAGTTLANPTTWGTAPSGNVPGVNAYIAGGSLTTSISGFQPTPAYQTLAVSGTSSRVALPSGTSVIVYNTGANAAYVTLGNSSVTATVSNDVVPAGSWMAFSVGANTNLAAIENAGTTTLTLSGGSGLPAGSVAGSGGGGGSNASVGATGSTAPTSATYNGMLVSGGNMVGVSGSAWGSAPAGLNVLGVNSNVLSMPSLPAGSNTIGGVNIASSLPAGSNVVGLFGINGSIPAGVNTIGGVNIASALPAGSNGIGSVSVSSSALPTGAATSANQTNGNQQAQVVDGLGNTLFTVSHPGQVAGTFSASFGGFTPTPSYASPLAVTTASARVALPSGTVVVAYNVGSSAAYCTLGSGSVTATTSNDVIQPGSWIEYTIGSNTDIACITAANTTTVNLSGGSGVMTGAGGGSSSGGGGGSGGNTPQATGSAAINISTATTTQLVAAVSLNYLYVTHFDVISGGTGNIQFEYGTGSNCGTGTTALGGSYPLTAQAGVSVGSGYGAIFTIPAGNALCAVTSAAVQYSGTVSYTQSATASTSFGGGGGSAFPSCCTSSQPGIVAPNSGSVWQVQLNGSNYLSAVPASKVLLHALTTTVTAVDTSPGVLSSIYCMNPGAALAYIQIFDAATGSVTLGSTVPSQSYGIPPGQASGLSIPMQGINFSTAISVAATTTATGSTAPGTALDCNATYN